MATKSPPAVVYMFVAPSGQAYVGQHGCYHAKWSDMGTGPLPDGYRGSSPRWAEVMREHGDAVLWTILRRFPAGTPSDEIDSAERAGVTAARRTYGEGCVNIFDGGRPSARDIRRLWARPDFKPRIAKEARHREMQEIISASPEIQAVIAEQEAKREARQRRRQDHN